MSVLRSAGARASLGLLGLAILFLAAGWPTVRDGWHYLREGELTDGLVVIKAIERATRPAPGGSRTDTRHNITYRFTARDGQPYEGSQDVAAATWERLEEHQPVPVQYVRSNPSMNRLAGQSPDFVEYLFPALGALAALTSAVFFVRAMTRAG